jgi:hypothetical protein
LLPARGLTSFRLRCAIFRSEFTKVGLMGQPMVFWPDFLPDGSSARGMIDACVPARPSS